MPSGVLPPQRYCVPRYAIALSTNARRSAASSSFFHDVMYGPRFVVRVHARRPSQSITCTQWFSRSLPVTANTAPRGTEISGQDCTLGSCIRSISGRSTTRFSMPSNAATRPSCTIRLSLRTHPS